MPIPNIDLVVGGKPIGFAYTKSWKELDGIIYKVPIYQLTAKTDSDQSLWRVLRFGVKKSTARAKPSVVGISKRGRTKIQGWNPFYKVHSAYTPHRGGWIVQKPHYLIHGGPAYPGQLGRGELFATLGCIEICGPGGFDLFNNSLLRLAGLRHTDKTTRNRQLANLGRSGKLWITFQVASRPPLVESGRLYMVVNQGSAGARLELLDQ